MLRTLLAALLALAAAAPAVAAAPASAPGFAGATGWINSPPLTARDLRGKVVLVDFWTFDCSNCLHALPAVKALDATYRDRGLVVVGVHTPELADERDTGHLRAAVKRLGIAYPVAQDNDYAVRNAWRNAYWPAQYLVDRHGRVVYTHVGEGGYDAIERAVREALADTR